MKQALQIARVMWITGNHLYNSFASEQTRQTGWKMRNDARRICRRLGWKPEAVLP